MDAAKALSDLKSIATQVEHAVVFEGEGNVVASTLADEERADSVARTAARLLDAAGDAAPGGRVVQLEAALEDASIVVVRDEKRAIAAVTRPQPTIGLVFYDLRACLRDLDDPPPAKPAAQRKKKDETDANA
jgi:predicted regulator of Ras-like GTPase activity (Roadblock/LC7/MglB family)